MLTHSFSQWYAAKLDAWDCEGIFTSSATLGMLWVILGISNQIESNPVTVYFKAHPTSFNRVARVFWEHLLFDRLASVAGFSNGLPQSVEPDRSMVLEIFKKEGVPTVWIPYPFLSGLSSNVDATYSPYSPQLFKGFLFQWTRHLDDLFEVKLPASHAKVGNSRGRSSRVILTPPSTSTIHTQLTTSSTTYTPVGPAPGAPPAPSVSTSVLLKSVALDIDVSTKLAVHLLETVRARDQSMRMPNVLNNFALAGASLSLILSVRQLTLCFCALMNL